MCCCVLGHSLPTVMEAIKTDQTYNIQSDYKQAVQMASISHVANFGARFCNELSINTNCICSPLSAETVLALVALGSSNQARTEIFQALDIVDEENLRSIFTALTTTLSSKEQFEISKTQSNREITLKIANKIYVKHGGALKATLKEDAEKVFLCSLEQIDFTKSSEAANAINKWVANETNNINKHIVSADKLSKDTRLVLVNAIYFHGFWEIPFKAKDTRTGNFHVNNIKKIQIVMMNLTDRRFNYKYSPKLKAKILQMFYVGGTASMVVVLPDKVKGLSHVMKQLTAGHDLMADVKSLQKTYLKVVMPKFKVETEIDLKELLQKMGIKTIFDSDKPDIDMLSSNDPLYVSEAIQKAFIAVDEMGTEAAAATCLRMQRCSGPFWEEEFIADRPFLYLLTAHEIPIFYGIFHGDGGNGSPQQRLLQRVQQWFRKSPRGRLST